MRDLIETLFDNPQAIALRAMVRQHPAPRG
jgi:hypothetical protein